MNKGLRELQPCDLVVELERVLFSRFAEVLRNRDYGHCMKISDLDIDLMIRLCKHLRAEIPEAEIVILENDEISTIARDFTVTSTKLVELRNPLPDGSLRPPLLVFVPSELRASVEDSFGVATFEDLDIGDVYKTLRTQLIEELSDSIRGALAESLRHLQDQVDPWPFADEVSVVRFLITAKINGGDLEAIGAAIYELGLIPDFELLAQPVQTPRRITRNRECVTKLTWSPKSERGRVLDIGLKDKGFRNELGKFLTETGVEDPGKWTRCIILDRGNWRFAFNYWEFGDAEEEPDSIFIGEVHTDLPTVDENESEERLSQLTGQQILPLGKAGLRKFSVSFHVDPHPAKVQGLSKFALQVISKEHGPVGLTRSKTVWRTNAKRATVSFAKLSRAEWEEGWHFVRILPQTEDGELIPLVDEEGLLLPWIADSDDMLVSRPNESDLFYVIPDAEVEVEPKQRTVQRESSLSHAKLRLQFSALLDERDPNTVEPTAVTWTNKKERGQNAGSDMLEVRFGREGIMHVPVSRILRNIEHGILTAPEGPMQWYMPISNGIPGQLTSGNSQWPESPTTHEFLAARRRYFEAVEDGTHGLVTQGVDIHALSPQVLEYAHTYSQLIQESVHRAETGKGNESEKTLADLCRLLAIDSILLGITDHRGQRHEAALISPTHPLRALWLVVWAELGHVWINKSGNAPKESIIPTREALLRKLAPLGFPPILPTDTGRLFTAVDNLHHFWTLYAPSSEHDPRGLVGQVCKALDLPEPGIGGSMIDGVYLASRIQRYLVQHPYVHTLIINAFNPGRASVLADMLLALQKQSTFRDIRYNIRLFVPDPNVPEAGEALRELLRTTTDITALEADAFSTPTENHLRPKLSLAVLPNSEFRRVPDAHAAHLTMLFDVFPAKEIGTVRPSVKETNSPVHGLIQHFQIEYKEDDSVIAWHRHPSHGAAQPIADAEELTDLLSRLPELMSNATAMAATAQTGLSLRPVVTLTLDAEDRALLHQVHEISDWVITVDRNMGIEFFDHGGTVGRPDYIIDHSPDFASQLGHRLVITSRSLTELEALLRPVMEEYSLGLERRHTVAILDQLRALSGRLALKLISSPTQRVEALGLALARIYLEHQNALQNQIVVPLDTHLELYRELKKQADELGDEISFKRTDLAIFDLNASKRTITCRLVEVKCYSQIGNVGALNQLKGNIAEQIDQSVEVLSYHFDPHRNPVDRPDRLVKTRELATLLEFYLDRAARYRTLDEDAEEEARFLLYTLEDGYRLDFTRSALIFDFGKTGTEPPEIENGIEYHRIGRDLVQQIIEAVSPKEESSSILEQEYDLPIEEPARSISDPQGQKSLLPKLNSAAFLGIQRDRSISWTELHTRRVLGDEQIDNAKPRNISQESVVQEQTGFGQVGDVLKEEDVSVSDTTRASEEAEEFHQQMPPSVKDITNLSESPEYDVLLGVTDPSPQYGLLGEVSGRKIAIDLNQTHTISLFGIQGGGKSYTLGTIAEMASILIPHINSLPQPLATVIFHYSRTMEYKPEFTSMVAPNSSKTEIQILSERYGATPMGLSDMVLLVPAEKLSERQVEYPGIQVVPLQFAAAELQASQWRFLMGAIGNQAAYIRQLNRMMRSLRGNLTLDSLREGVDGSSLPSHLKELASMRLDLAAEYIDDNSHLSSIIHPGRLIIVDLRDEFIEKDEALGLFVVLLQLFADAKHEGRSFNKLVVFDEAHKYIESSDLVAGLVEVVREMRHKGTSVMVASQDPPSVPVSLIELSTQIILHRFNSPAWLKHIQKANAALSDLTPEKMAHLGIGEAYIWSSKATDEAFTKGTVKVKCRPRVTLHGGGTKTAVDGGGLEAS